MRTETINIYTLDELSEAAKAKAIEHYRNTLTEPFHYNGEAVKWWPTDMEYQLSDEYIAEHMMANEYEFTQDGKEWTQ